MKEKWLKLTWPQRVFLLLQGFLILLFLVLYCTLGRQQVVWYDGAALRCAASGDAVTYSGRVDGQRAVFTVSPGPVVEYRLGDTFYGPYSIRDDATAVPDEEDVEFSTEGMVGVEILEGSDVLFRGAYLDWGGLMLFDESGERIFSEIIYEGYVPVSSAAPSVPDILQLAVAPEIVQRGQFAGFWLGLLCCAACAVSIWFADALFRFNLSFSIRNAESAEPTEWALFTRWVGWIALTVMALVVFILGLSAH